MRKITITITLIFGTILAAAAQDVKAKLSEAESAYANGNLEEARFALQQSLAELDVLVGQEIIKVLPGELSGISADIENDQMTGGAGLTGVYVERIYPDTDKTVRIEIITNSPFLAMVTSALNNPLLASMSGGNQKVVKIAGYKSLVEKTEGEFGQQHDVKIPVNDSMILIMCDGFSQGDAVAVANSLDIKGIVQLISSAQ